MKNIHDIALGAPSHSYGSVKIKILKSPHNTSTKSISVVFVIAGMCAGALAIGLFVRNPDSMQVRVGKFEPLDTIEVAAIGPSYVRNNFDPEIFDQDSRAYGFNGRSINLGFENSGEVELRHDLTELHRLSLPSLKLVLIDLTLPHVVVEKWNQLHPRTLATNESHDVAMAIGRYFRRGENVTLADISRRSLAVLSSFLNVGIANAQLSRWLRNEPVNSGFTPVKEPVIFDPEEFRRAHNAFVLAPVNPCHWMDHMRRRLEILDHWRGEFGRRGVEVVGMIAPVFYLPLCKVEDPILAKRFIQLNDPERFAELFRPEDRRTLTHHLPSAAPPYTKAVARELAWVWKERAS